MKVGAVVLANTRSYLEMAPATLVVGQSNELTATNVQDKD